MPWNKAYRGAARSDTPIMPDSFKCAVGGEWRPAAQFSKRQRDKVQQTLARGGKVDPANANITCVEHSGQPTLELQCEGPCRMVRGLDSFSATTRRNKENICIECQMWAESQEQNVIPWAAPNNELSRDEQHYPSSSEDLNEELITPNAKDNMPLAPITGELGEFLHHSIKSATESFKMDRLEEALTESGKSNTGSIPPKWLYPHLTDPQGSAGPSKSTVASSIAEDEEAQAINMLPPHAREVLKKAKGRDARDTLPPHIRTSGPVSTATTMYENKEREGAKQTVIFNAWDNQGQAHIMTKAPTVQSLGSATLSSFYEGGSRRTAKDTATPTTNSIE